MIASVLGCDITEVLHDGPRSLVCRARRRSDGVQVIIKMPSDGAPRPECLRGLHREWEVLQALGGLEGVVAAEALDRDGDQYGLILHDFGAVSMQQLALAGTQTIERTLTVALDIVGVIEQIHNRGVVHRDLNPFNLLLNPSSLRVKLADFASASLLGHQLTSSGNLHEFAGYVAYISPELTGRMNRRIDYRSDYYSFGIVLFELLTGALPFDSEDPLELVHAHIARRPPAPADFNPAVPAALSRIVLKLLSKDADDRYQSTSGIRQDLARCRTEIAAGRIHFDFSLGKGDRGEHFRLPQRLYGREAETRRLSAALDRACGGVANLVALRGPAGIGKSALVRELLRPVSARHGYFAVATFEQDQGSGPYAAVARALEHLVRQLLTESAEALTELRARIDSALPNIGQALFDLCPSMRLILGSRAALPTLGPEETRTRLHQALAASFAAVAGSGNPVCILWDDVQWASPDSLDLLKEIALTARTLPLLLVVAYRDNERAREQIVAGALSQLELACVPIDHLCLSPLTRAAITAFVTDAFSLPSPDAMRLVDLVCSRTGSNPFFARAFLEALLEDGGLTRTADGFALDLARVQRRGVTDNVVDLLIERIARLPQATQQTLTLAACLGNRFEISVVNEIAGREAGPDLWPAIQAELVLPADHLHSPDALATPSPQLAICFSHDRVRQAVLSMLPPESQRRLRLQIGRHLLANKSAAGSDRLFEMVAHLNYALELLDRTERVELAALNLKVAKDALGRGAGAEALEIARAGISALAPDAWSNTYQLALDLHIVAAESSFAWAHHEALAPFVNAVTAHARSPIDAARARRLEGRVHQALARSDKAIETYVETLASLGIVLPSQPGDEERDRELDLAAAALRGMASEDLLNLPQCLDSGSALAMDLLSKLIFFAYSSAHPLLPIVVCRLVRLSVERGNTAESANGYTFYGLLLSRDNDLDRACQFGQLALDLAHRFNVPEVLSQTYLHVNYQLMHWKVTPSKLAESFRTAFRYGLEAGSPRNASCSATTLCICRFWAGDALDSLAADLEQYRAIIVRFRQARIQNWHDVLLQLVNNLRDEPAEPACLRGIIYEETSRVPKHHEDGDGASLFNYYIAKTFACYLFGRWEEALETTEKNQRYAALFARALWAAPFLYLDTLCRLAAYREASLLRRAELLPRIRENTARMATWLPYNRRSIEHRLKTIQAEMASIEGDDDLASRLFADAVDLAAAAGASHEEAIACELAGRHCLRTGERVRARTHLRAAFRAYGRWGATAKARALEREHGELISRSSSIGPVSPVLVRANQDFDLLDLVGVLNASRAISSEIKLGRLLQRLMSLLIESAGAQVGYLLLDREGEWLVEVGQSVERGNLTTQQSLSMADLASLNFPGIASSIVRYVARTGETVMLADASRSDEFARDPHIDAAQVLSVLCFPLKRRGETVAIGYLENNILRNAFTKDGRRLVEMLSSQAVVSLENATLYDSLERQVQTRTQQLREKNDELATAVTRLIEIQGQMVTQEKLAALGALTAGIAHEIKNPLNFVTNFAQVSMRISAEMQARVEQSASLDPPLREDLGEMMIGLRQAIGKITEHGTRATKIISAMALHARGNGGSRELADLNAILSQSASLASHGSSQRRGGSALIATHCDPTIGKIEMVVQDMSRVFVNLISNARYSVEQKVRTAPASFEPRITISTLDRDDKVEVRICDNGMGIPAALMPRIFLPFFTTKPAGEGTGLGLSISHDIVVYGHGGKLEVETVEGESCEFVVLLPKRQHGPPSALPAAN